MSVGKVKRDAPRLQVLAYTSKNANCSYIGRNFSWIFPGRCGRSNSLLNCGGDVPEVFDKSPHLFVSRFVVPRSQNRRWMHGRHDIRG